MYSMSDMVRDIFICNLSCDKGPVACQGILVSDIVCQGIKNM